MPFTPAPALPGARAVPKDGAYGADANQLRDRVTAAIGDQYLIGEEVGRGGMAVVYAAEDVRLQRPVALKVLPPELAFRADVRERFVREAQTAARLNHPHIVPIYAVHEAGGLVCFAMSLVRGESLAARMLREGRPSFEFVARVLEQTADALAYAHACGVVHRDIKPDNVLIDRESGRAMVTDFGIARAAEGGSRLTQTGIAVGTPAFMSPEQAMGDKEVDGRSDLYSLGVVGYLLVGGKLPFEATSTPAMLMKHVGETPPSLRLLRPDAPRALVDILERCLAKRPQDRFDSAMQLRDALRRAQRDGSLGAQRAADAAPSRAPRLSGGWSDGGDGAPARRGSSDASPETSREPYREPLRDDRIGHRSEDWAPRQVIEPAPAPRQLPAPGVLPPIPQLPPLPPGADRRTQREWKKANQEAIKDWRVAVRTQREALESEWREQHRAARPDVSPELRIRRFKRGMVRKAVLVGGAVAFNLAVDPNEPIFLLAAVPLSVIQLAQYWRLRRRGIRWAHIFGDEPIGHDAKNAVAVSPATTPERIARLVAGFKRHLTWFAGSAGTAMLSAMIGFGFDIEPMAAPLMVGALGAAVSGALSLADWRRLHRLGVSTSDALGDGWQKIAAASDTRTFDVKVRDRLIQLAGDGVLASRFGETIRNAVDDRLTIDEIVGKLSDADKSLIPEVGPTAEALVERVAALASGLERLDRDLPGDALPQLDARIASVEAEPSTAPDRERRLTLLTRQRASLQELADRRDVMQRQLDSASMALRSLRYDIVKLRTIGVDASIHDVTSATQEARALSRDLGYVLEAADEARRL